MTHLWQISTAKDSNQVRRESPARRALSARWALAAVTAIGAVTLLTLVLFSALSHWQTGVRVSHGPRVTTERAIPDPGVDGSYGATKGALRPRSGG